MQDTDRLPIINKNEGSIKMENYNKIKDIQLGMSHGKASQILRKSIIFDFAKRLDLDDCYRCNKKIKDIKELSIEHKENWLNSKDPIGLFFSLDNIAFSHLTCNIGAVWKDKKFSEEHCNKISESHIGKVMSEETKAKMKVIVNTVCKTPEFKLKVSNAMKESYKNRPQVFHTQETKEKISKSMSGRFGEQNNFFGRKHSEETKRKISEAMKK